MARRDSAPQKLIPGCRPRGVEPEADGFVARRQEDGPPVKVVYSLTNYGRSLNAGMEHLAVWGRAHQKLVAGRGATPKP
jgi:DNA-binding HxlR family transcriptional regulator